MVYIVQGTLVLVLVYIPAEFPMAVCLLLSR
jgi:hypothetical protein